MHEHGTKTTPVFLPTDGEASWSLLPSSVSLLSGGTLQTENTYSCILKVTGQVCESQKRISITLITATTLVHLAKPVSIDLTIKPDSVLTNPIGKDGLLVSTIFCISARFYLPGIFSRCFAVPLFTNPNAPTTIGIIDVFNFHILSTSI